MGRFKQVDVFTKKKYLGNPVAVYLDADELTTEEMQRIANWTNLSETTFVLKPEDASASYRVRIFSPTSEFPFAGHPTIGTCFALLEAGEIKPDADGCLVQECKAGLVKLQVSGSTISFTAPYTKAHEVTESQAADARDALHLQPDEVLECACIETGPIWFNVVLATQAKVLEFQPDFAAISDFSKKYGVSGIQIVSRTEDPERELRTFAPIDNVNEDPVCGSGSASVGAMLLLPASTGPQQTAISQGSQRGRAGHVYVSRTKEGRITVGGSAVTVVDGTW